MSPRPRYHLTLEALPDGVPPEQRLKRLLKMLLRGYGMKCLSAEEIRADPLPSAEVPTQPDAHLGAGTR